jgi:hypothetical protein
MNSPRFRLESKIYLGRLGVWSPRFILDIYLFTIGFFEIIFLNVYIRRITARGGALGCIKIAPLGLFGSYLDYFCLSKSPFQAKVSL